MTRLTTQGLDITIEGQALCRSLQLTLHPGECWGILGGNGSGKTSLLHTLAGLLPHSSGTILLDDMPLKELQRRQIAQHLGILLQESHTAFPSTVLDTVLSGRHPHMGRWQQEGEMELSLAHQAMAVMDLQDLGGRLIQSLSGGEQRRVQIATLLTQAPQLMLLDEPLNHLDLHHQQHLLRHLASLVAQGRSVVMVLHDPNQALRYCDQILMLYGNGEWESGSSIDMLSEERLSRLYNHPIRLIGEGKYRCLIPE